MSVEASLSSFGIWVSGLAVTIVSKLFCSFEIYLVVAVTLHLHSELHVTVIAVLFSFEDCSYV